MKWSNKKLIVFYLF